MRKGTAVALALLLGTGVTGAAACSSQSSAVASESPKALANSTPDEVVVDNLLAIPEVREEVITPEGSKEELWIPGYWERDPDEWTWIPGHWEHPPNQAAHWETGHWAWESDAWHWRRGHWVVDTNPLIVEQQIPVPELLPEVKPAPPSDKNHWVAGYWEWDGSWSWVPGRWTNKPDPKAEWVPGQWEEYRTGGWRWTSGHWKLMS
jgi:hypothetical protein